MIIPGALEAINIELIRNLYREITPEVEVLDEVQGIQAVRQLDGTMGYTVPTKTVQPEADPGMTAIVSAATARTAKYIQAAAQVQTDPTSGVGKVY